MPDPGVLWTQAVTASQGGRHDRAVTLLRAALAPADEHPAAGPDLRMRIMVSLALAESEVAGLEAGLAVLAEAEKGFDDDAVTTRSRGAWHGQRALLMVHAGQPEGAHVDFEHAIAMLAQHPSDLCKVLLNRGVVGMRSYEFARAEEDLEQAYRVAEVAGDDTVRAMAIGNLGYVAYLRNDLARALRLIERSDAMLAGEGMLNPGTAARGRADILLAAGLLTEAEAEFRTATQLLTRSDQLRDKAEAELRLAEIARLKGDFTAARTLARRAIRHFEMRGSAGWGLLAELELAHTEALARPALGAEQSAALRNRLDAQGLHDQARIALLLEVGSLLRVGKLEAARRRMRGRRWTSSSWPIGTRMLGHETRAAMAEARHRTLAAQRARREGLADLQAFQSRLGSIDLLTAATRIGAGLAADGLAEAVSGGDPAEVLSWSEQVRATGSRVPSLPPPHDPEMSELLARLRYLHAEEREAALGGRPDRALAAEVKATRARVRERSWQLPGAGTVLEPVELDTLRDQLGPDATMLSLTTVGGDVHALAVSADRADLHPLAPATWLREQVLRIRADLDLLAGNAVPATLRAIVARSLHGALVRLSRLLEPILAAHPHGPVLLVPTGQSVLVPWPMLDALGDRTLSVVPSATWWSRTRSEQVRPAGRSVFVAGPDVARAEPEVWACAADVDSTVLVGQAASTAATLEAMDGAEVLHVAAHGRHEPDNPLFSSLLMADGWLFGHDLDVVTTLPRHVVLSACETGMARIRPGDEALGMTATLLHRGSRSVVAAVARVGDEVAERVAVRYHAAVREGAGPASALSRAVATTGDDVPAPMVCFGVGW